MTLSQSRFLSLVFVVSCALLTASCVYPPSAVPILEKTDVSPRVFEEKEEKDDANLDAETKVRAATKAQIPDIEIVEPHCSILCSVPPPGCHYEGGRTSGPCSKVTCGRVDCGPPSECRSGDMRTRACTSGGIGGVRKDRCVTGHWTYGTCTLAPAPQCGSGELLCARTNQCYNKTRPWLCWECSTNSDCGPSAICDNHRCFAY